MHAIHRFDLSLSSILLMLNRHHILCRNVHPGVDGNLGLLAAYHADPDLEFELVSVTMGLLVMRDVLDKQ